MRGREEGGITYADFLSNISRAIGGTEDDELRGVGLEVLSLRDGDGSLDMLLANAFSKHTIN